MKWLLYFMLLAMACASLTLFALQAPGYVEVVWLGFEVRFPVVVGALIFLILFFIGVFLIHALSWLLRMPSRWASSSQRSRDTKAMTELLALVSSFEAENLVQALHHQKKAEKFLATDPLFLWISGNAFEKANKPLEAARCFGELAQHPLAAAFLGRKGQIRAAFHWGDFQLASVLLEDAEKLVPTSPWVLKRLLALARARKDVTKAKELILRLEDLGYLSSDNSQKQIASLQSLET